MTISTLIATHVSLFNNYRNKLYSFPFLILITLNESFEILLIVVLFAVMLLITRNQQKKHHTVQNELLKLNQQLTSQIRQQSDNIREHNQILQQEIIDHKQTEIALQQSEAGLMALIENTKDIIWSVDWNNYILVCNSVFKNIYKFATNESISSGNPVSDSFHQFYFENKKPYEKAFQGNSFVVKSQIIINNAYCYYENTFNPIRNKQNEIVGVSVFGRDATKRTYAEIYLKEREERYRLLTERSSAAIVLINRELIQFVNPSFSRILGFSSEEVLGHKYFEFILTDDNKLIIEMLQQKKQIVEYETTLRHKKGYPVHVEVSADFINQDNDSELLVFLYDISERVNVELELRQRVTSERMLSAIASNFINLPNETIDNELGEALSLLCDFLHIEQAHIFRYFAAKRQIVCTHSWCMKGFSPFVEIQQEIPELLNSWENGLLGKQKVFIIPSLDDFTTNFTEFKELLHSKSIKSLIIIQLREKNGFTGFIIFPTSFEQKTWIDMDINTLTVASEIVISALIRQEMERQVIDAKEVAETANRVKTEFLSNMSHEIRTPLNAILGFTDILRDKMVDYAPYAEYLNGIKVAGKNLLLLIDDILDLAKIDSGKLEIRLETVNPLQVINEIKQIFSLQSQRKGLSFQVLVDKDLPKSLYLDHIRFRQILFNLVGNAVKFTEQGGITININGVRKDFDKSTLDLFVDVIDTGIGIDPEQYQEVFKPFHKSNSNTQNKYSGTGLGLTITQRLIKMMNGNLQIDSQLGEGSTFRIHIPNVDIAVSTNEVENIFDNQKLIRFNKASVLLVEDIESNRKVIRDFLESHNLQVVEAENGREALKVLKTSVPNLIIMDIQMPVMDGFRATRLIKSSKEHQNIPVIALTALATNDDIQRIKEICDDYLNKPVTKDQIITKLSEYLPFQLVDLPSVEIPVNDTYYVDLMHNYDIFVKNYPDGFCNCVECELMPVYQVVTKSLSITSIMQFAQSVVKIAGDYHIDALKNFGQDLYETARTFKFNLILKQLQQFQTIYDIIKNKQKS